MEPDLTTMTLYPFGRLFPLLSGIAEQIQIRPKKVSQNWINAAQQDDLDSMYSIVELFNRFRETEYYSRLAPEQIEYIGAIKSGRLILHTISKLRKNDNNSNKKVSIILIEILKYFYDKFTNLQQLVDFMILLGNLIDYVEKLLLLPEDLFVLKNKPQFVLIKQSLKELFLQLGKHEPKNTSLKTKQQKSTPIQQDIQQTLIELLASRLLGYLLSTLIYIKLDFLSFIDSFLQEEQIKDIKQIYKNKNSAEMRKNHGVKDTIYQPQIYFKEYMNHLFSISKNHSSSNLNLFFFYVQPLLYYFPTILLNWKNQQQRQLILKEFFINTIDLINKFFSEESIRQQNNKNSAKIITKKGEFIRAFRNTNILNNIETALIGYFEGQIRQYKGIQDYEEKYQQCLQYFSAVFNIKSHIIENIENVWQRYFNKWQGANILLRQIKKLQTQKQQKAQGKQKAAPIKQSKQRLSIYKKNRKKNTKKSNIMEQIMQEDQQDNSTVYDFDESFSRNDDDFTYGNDYDQTDYYGDYDEVNLQPLVNFRDKGRKSDKKAGKSIQKPKNDNRGQLPTTKSTTQQVSTNLLDAEQEDIIPQVMETKTFITYYQHHYHSYQSRQIFRTQYNTYYNRDIDPYDCYSGESEVTYPDIINRDLYEIQEFMVAENKKIEQSLKDNRVHLLTQELREKRLKLKRKKAQIQQKQNPNRSSTKATKPTQNLNKLRVQKNQLQKQLIDSQLKLRRLAYSNRLMSINFFPLTSTEIGDLTLASLAKELQLWMKLNDLKRRQKNNISQKDIQKSPFRTKKQLQNPFNLKIIMQHNSYQINVQELQHGQELKKYFFTLIYDLMVVLFESENPQDLEQDMLEFHKIFFSRLDLSHKAILLYYMYEFGMKEHLGFHQFIKRFVSEIISQRQIYQILRFLILDLKIQRSQMNWMYMNLYDVLTENCFATLKKVFEIFLHDIVPNVQQVSEINLQTLNSNYDESKFRQLQAMKSNFNNLFQLLIDMLFMWIIMTFGVKKFNQSLMNTQTIEEFEKQMLFYCPQCSNLMFVLHTPQKAYNYQEPFCNKCQNSLMDRFEMQTGDSQFLHMIFNQKHRIKMLIYEILMNIEQMIEENRWQVKEAKFRKQEYNGNSQNMYRTQTVSQQKDSQKNYKNGNRQRSANRNYMDESPPKRNKSNNDRFNSKAYKNRNNDRGRVYPSNSQLNWINTSITQNQNFTASSNKRTQSRYLSSANRKALSFQRQEFESPKSSQNQRQPSSQQVRKQKIKSQIEFNHEYCFNAQRILRVYLKHILNMF